MLLAEALQSLVLIMVHTLNPAPSPLRQCWNSKKYNDEKTYSLLSIICLVSFYACDDFLDLEPHSQGIAIENSDADSVTLVPLRNSKLPCREPTGFQKRILPTGLLCQW
jgi:hypothetical protein